MGGRRADGRQHERHRHRHHEDVGHITTIYRGEQHAFAMVVVRQRHSTLGLESDAPDERVVVQVGTDLGQIGTYRDAVFAQVIGRSEPREHQ